MPTVLFQPIGCEVEVPVGTSILEAARIVGAPHGSRCGGVCACSKCHVYVESGADLLNHASEDELDLIELSAAVPQAGSRLGCQATLEADGQLVVTISQESFEAYLEEKPAQREDALNQWLQAVS